MSRNLIEKAQPIWEQAIETYRLGDEVYWDLSLVPTNIGPAYLFMLVMQGLTISEGSFDTLAHVAVIQNPLAVFDYGTADSMVRVGLEDLRGQRSRSISGSGTN